MTRTARRFLLLLLPLLCLGFSLLAQQDKDFPAKPNPLRPVNDFAHVLTAEEVSTLGAKIAAFDRQTSTTIIIVTLTSIGDYDVAQYNTELGNRWGIGREQKNNGVVVLAAIKEHRINISVGRGLEGALPDAIAGRIIRNEMSPAFKGGNYGEGFSRAIDAIIAATKGEYTADPQEEDTGRGRGRSIGIIIAVIVILWILSRRGGGGGGSYMSGRGRSSWLPPVIFWGGGGGFGGGGGGFGGGGGGFGGGDFGGAGGGSFGGGGASGSW
jgi:uncharacterized protein